MLDFRGENRQEMLMNEKDTVTREVMEGMYWVLDSRSHIPRMTSIVFNGENNATVTLSNGITSHIDYTSPLEFVNGLIRSIEEAGK